MCSNENAIRRRPKGEESWRFQQTNLRRHLTARNVEQGLNHLLLFGAAESILKAGVHSPWGGFAHT